MPAALTIHNSRVGTLRDNYYSTSLKARLEVPERLHHGVTIVLLMHYYCLVTISGLARGFGSYVADSAPPTSLVFPPSRSRV